MGCSAWRAPAKIALVANKSDLSRRQKLDLDGPMASGQGFSRLGLLKRILSFMKLRAGNSHYQYWCLGAPALSGPNLSLTMLPHQRVKSAAPAYSRSPKTNSELPAEMAMYCLPPIE